MNPKLLTLLLLLSLGINLALAGYLVGRLDHPSRGPFGAGASEMNLHLLRRLPDDRREFLKPAMRAYFKAIHSDARGMHRAQRQLVNAIRREPFEPVAVNNALQVMDQQFSDLRKAGRRPFIDLLQQLTPTERELISTPARAHGRSWDKHRLKGDRRIRVD